MGDKLRPPYGDEIKQVMKPQCSPLPYDAVTGFLQEPKFNVINIFRHTTWLLRSLAREERASNRKIRIWIYGASISGKLAHYVITQNPDFQFMGFIDPDDRFQESLWHDIGVADSPGETVVPLEEVHHEQCDVVLMAQGPSEHNRFFTTFHACESLRGTRVVFLYRSHHATFVTPDIPPVVVSGPARSGTNWLKNLLDYMMPTKGYEHNYTFGNQEHPHEQLRHGQYAVFHYSMNDELKDAIQSGKTKGIFIYRDPRDVMISRTKREFNEFIFDPDMVEDIIGKIDAWLAVDGALTLKYEDLHAAPLVQLKRIADYLNMDMDDDYISKTIDLCSFNRLSKNRTQPAAGCGPLFRKGVTREWEEIFTQEQKDLLSERFGNDFKRLKFD